MISQLMYLISPEVIGDIIDHKLGRQIERICAEKGLCEHYYPVYGEYAKDGDLCINDGMSAGTCHCKGDREKCIRKEQENG